VAGLERERDRGVQGLTRPTVAAVVVLEADDLRETVAGWHTLSSW